MRNQDSKEIGQSIRLHVEHTHDSFASVRRVALVDTESLDANLALEESLKVNLEASSESSMLAIDYDCEGCNGLKEGSWYEIPLSVLSEGKYDPILTDSPSALYKRAKLVLPSPLNFTRYLASPKFAETEADQTTIKADVEDMKLNVIDCGQANWNEISSACQRIFFDVGASRKYTAAEVKSLVTARNLTTDGRDTHIVISHWDIDHYQALLAFTPADFQTVKSIVGPSQIPDTATYQRVEKMLVSHNLNFTTMGPAKPDTKCIVLKFEKKTGPYSFYRATPGRSRNQTGIVMVAEGDKKVAILTGDHHYEKILEAVKGRYHGKQCILVSPHHGGHAGTIETSKWQAEFSKIITPISVGRDNPSNHPIQGVVDDLKVLQGGVDPEQTQNDGDITYPL